MRTLVHTAYLASRLLRNLLRQPWWIAISISQPIIWLVFYGQLFKNVVELPGFDTTSYIGFITPGIVIMSALFSSGWTGMDLLEDLDRGVMDRFLVSPVSRFAIVAGHLLSLCTTVSVQSVLLISLGLLLGAHISGGPLGIAVLFASAILLTIPIGALSISLALTLRKMESVIAAVNFVLLPLTFLSPVFMAKPLMPQWMQVASRFNPVSWGVEAARASLDNPAEQILVLLHIASLAAFGLACAWLAIRAFRSYQRSV